jgi:hypothetical protein
LLQYARYEHSIVVLSVYKRLENCNEEVIGADSNKVLSGNPTDVVNHREESPGICEGIECEKSFKERILGAYQSKSLEERRRWVNRGTIEGGWDDWMKRGMIWTQPLITTSGQDSRQDPTILKIVGVTSNSSQGSSGLTQPGQGCTMEALNLCDIGVRGVLGTSEY